MNLVYVCGIPATGKNTILKELMQNISTEKDIRIVSFGDVIKEYVQEKYPERFQGRDKIRTTFSYTEQKSIISRALVRILDSYYKSDIVILHGHSILNTHYGYLPGFPTIIYRSIQEYYPERAFPISLLVHIIAKPEHIFDRRNKDTTRERDIESLEEIKNHLDLSTIAMNSIAFNMFVPLLIADNSNERLASVIDQLCKAFVGREILSIDDLKEDTRKRLFG